MRIELEFELLKKEFPVDYTRPMISFLKHSLDEYDKSFYERVFLNGASVKNYSFSCYFHKAKFGQKFLTTEGDVMKVIFSCSNELDSALFLNAFMGQYRESFRLPNDNNMTLKRLEVLPGVEIKSETVLIKFLSPLLVQKHYREGNKSWFYTPQDAEFEVVLNNVLKHQLQEAGVEIGTEVISLKPIKMKSLIVPVFGLKVPASGGVFELTASTDVINYLYKAGMGSKRGAGFGLFEVIA